MTLRELVLMAQARQQDAWNHTAALLALLANVNRDPKKGRAFAPGDFHPMSAAWGTSRPPRLKGQVAMLKSVFVDPQLSPNQGGSL